MAICIDPPQKTSEGARTDVTVSGNVSAGSYSVFSDARFKTHIAPLSNALRKIQALHGVTFDWRSREFPEMRFSRGQQIGFIAQEVEQVLPELVSKTKQGYRMVDYVKVVPILVEAVKSQQQQIQTADGENTRLKAQLADQEARLARLETAKSMRSQTSQNTTEATSLGALLLLCGGSGGSLVMRRLRRKR